MNFIDKIFDKPAKFNSVTNIDNEDNLEVLGQRLNKVRIILAQQREYGNDWSINYWTMVEQRLRAKWDTLVLEQSLNMINGDVTVFDLGSATLLVN